MKKGFFNQLREFYIDRYEKMALPELEQPRLPIRKMTEDLMTVPLEVWGDYAFSRDRMSGRLTSSDIRTLTRSAADCGTDLARRYRCAYNACSLPELAQTLGITVKFPDRPSASSQVLFACFTEPDLIEICSDCLKKAEQCISENELGDLTDVGRITDLLLAHEIFHWAELQEKATIMTLNTTVSVWKLGKLENRAHITCLSEIAAMAFSREFTHSEAWPYYLDVLLSYLYDPNMAHVLYWEVKNREKSIYSEAERTSAARQF